MMDTSKLNKWADLLLDTGKRNNLINFKDTKNGTVEVVCPDFDTLFLRAEHSAMFEVYDAFSEEEEDIEELELESEDSTHGKYIPRSDYIDTYAKRIKKNNQVLLYNAYSNPVKSLENIGKKAKSALEETGVNIAYMAFGFINWTDDKTPGVTLRAPILLAPISIENESALFPHYIKMTDSELVVNPTFSFKLKNDYGMELPEYDDEGVSEYLEKVEALLSKLKWTVTKECKIGVFSFLKINMHMDLKENSGKILKNPGVRALLGEADLQYEDTREDKKEKSPLHNVVDADSSQSEAIELARRGKSFVLQGPPGTGKSQTITNIIAECLEDGKKVLFVSEKLAALNVVYDKLKRAGLDEFCLELHSHKANKKDVIDELCHTLKAQKSAVSDRAQREIDAKLRAEFDLDEYAIELHKVRPVINKTLYNMYEEVSLVRAVPEADFVIGDIRSKGEDYIEDAEAALTSYVGYIPSIGYNYRKNPFYGFAREDSSYEFVGEFRKNLEGCVAFCAEIKELNDILGKKYSITAKNAQDAYAIREFLDLIGESGFITPALLNPRNLSATEETLKEMKTLALDILNKRKALDAIFEEEIYEIDAEDCYRKLTKLYGNFFKRLFSSEYRRIVNEIILAKRDGKREDYRTYVSLMRTVSTYQRSVQRFFSLEKKVKDKIGGAYSGVETDFNRLFDELAALSELQEKRIDLGTLPKLNDKNFAIAKEELKALSESFSERFDRLSECEEWVVENFDPNLVNLRKLELERLENKYTGCLENLDSLDNWCEFAKLMSTLSTLGIKPFIDFAIGRRIAAEDILPTYKKAFYVQWIDSILREVPSLMRFSRIPHDETVKLFKEKDELNFEINKAKIKAKLSANRPNLDMIAQGSAVSVLLREGEKKRKQKGIRLLLEEIGDLVQTLKPCFLMSPLSVSTFLSANMNFDVVIFDEASQIFPQDAIGAIYRGRQLIVVGDSKQMPPSNFFSSNAIPEEDEEDDLTDFESILDICSTALMQKRLKWHYRSRFEQLISFSNKNFYDNDLVTFPSSKKDTVGVGVDYYYVDGVFDRKTKTNRIEAEKIVDLVFENIEKYPERSIGVVAFSVSQQNLIDKLITRRRQKDKSKEEFFKSDREEPFFVKNLETVQGDERDTIIFSVAYAKDIDGRFILNFGPVNREGGERRLNVAVTRAKYNVQLVSSLHYTDIDLSRTQSVGARLLREYLDYAENGEVALRRAEGESVFARRDSELVEEISEFLRDYGYETDTHLGCSALKIDVAVKHPNSDEDYLLAVECDGETYHSSKAARDRDRLRAEVLERMGWKYYRVWSTDWFRNKRVEKERLLDALKSAAKGVNPKGKKDTKKAELSFEEEAQNVRFEFPKYTMADERDLARKYNYSKSNVIRAIIEKESPISEEWLLRRVAFLFGREKVTSLVRDEFNYLVRGGFGCNVLRSDGFLYLESMPPSMLRVPETNAANIREVKYIHPTELALGMKEILRQNVTVSKNGLFRLLAAQLGYTRVGDAMQEHLESALKLISREIIENGEMLSLK